MAINIHCPKCHGDYSLKNKVCPKCGESLTKAKKFRVIVSSPKVGRITRIVEGSLSFARTVEGKIKAEVAQKKHLGIEKAPKVSEVWDAYISWAKQNKKGWKGDEQRYNLYIKKFIGNKAMDEILAKDVQKIIDDMANRNSARGKPFSPQTIKHSYALVKRLYNWAKEQDYYDGPNPAAKIKPPKVQNQKTECLTKEEMLRLFKTLDTWWNKRAALIVRFALLTGLRKGEILGLRFKDVNREDGFLTLEDPKGKPAVLPLCDDALAVIDEAETLLPDPSCEWVFPNKWGNQRSSFNKIWNNIKQKAKLPEEFRFHGLRHTYASYMASSGEVDLYTLQKLLNHQTPQMTQRYAHLMDEALRRGANVAGKVLNGNGGGKG